MANDTLTRKKDMAKLRGRMDGDDRFFESHQIRKVRRLERNIPAWTLNNAEVQKVLLRSSPNLRNRIMKARAARWARIIHLYYRMQLPNSQVAKEMGISLNALKMALKHIRRVAAGIRTDNVGALGANPRGRPKGVKNKS